MFWQRRIRAHGEGFASVWAPPSECLAAPVDQYFEIVNQVLIGGRDAVVQHVIGTGDLCEPCPTFNISSFQWGEYCRGYGELVTVGGNDGVWDVCAGDAAWATRHCVLHRCDIACHVNLYSLWLSVAVSWSQVRGKQHLLPFCPHPFSLLRVLLALVRQFGLLG